MSPLALLAAVAFMLSNVHLVHVQDLSGQANANVHVNNDHVVVSSFEEWKRHPLFLPSFEPEVLTIPQVQKEFVNNMVASDLDFFREILQEAINKRNTFAPSVSLMWKYTSKLLRRFINNRREEQKISPRIEPLPAFFESLANLAELVINRSDEIKKERGYNKNSVNVDDLYKRVDGAFRYIQRVITQAPVGAYLKWNGLAFYRDDVTHPCHNRDIIEEAGELTAQFRAMGYDKCIFVAKRIINLLRMFSKGSIPASDKDV